jgi:glutaconate CoA-transferase subunit A
MMMYGFRAGSMGIPSMPVRGVLGSDVVKVGLEKGNYKIIKDPFTGEDILFTRAIEPDVTLLHAQRADIYGNVQIWGGRFEDLWQAKASKKVIVSVEEIVDPEMIKLEPYKTALIHPYVDAVVHIPRGAYPTSCYGVYDPDYDHIREYAKAVRDNNFQKYLDVHVYKKRGDANV